jgi:hypothetical protein
MSLFYLQSAQPTAPHAHYVRVLRWLTHLGPLGVFAVAVLDSSVVPLPLPEARIFWCFGSCRMPGALAHRVCGCCGQCRWRVHDLARGFKRRTSSVAALCASLPAAAAVQMSGSKSNAGCLALSLASAAVSTHPACPRLRRSRRAPPPFSCCLRCCAQSALRARGVAGRFLRA